MSTRSPTPIRPDADDTAQETAPEEETQDDEHCTICLQAFLDKTLLPMCAHAFCFECILLWSAQSRKCPLCARSFEDAYLIHRIRSQYDYQKHYLPPLRTSTPPSTAESRATVLRRTRRERQWGRRQRQEREEADQLERAIARRRWLYQHHLYAKHIASNAYTRYRPFPTPAQFAASPDLISRMTIFLRRELRVWPNLDVEFLTTYTISLMKSIDIRSESAVKLLSEFLDLDSPYTPGARRANAEHFAHEIYSYLRSPYRDLNIYDQTAQYDTPPGIAPPEEIQRGNRWRAERSPSRRSRSPRSHSRHRSPVPHRDGNAIHDRDRSAERGDRPRRRRSPRPDDHLRNHPSDRRHSPRGGIQDRLRNGPPHGRGTSAPEGSRSADQDAGASRGDAEADNVRPVAMVPRGDEAVEGPLIRTGTGDDVNRVDALGGSSANGVVRKRVVVGVHPRHRTLSASVQAHLGSGARERGEGGVGVEGAMARPALLARLTDGPVDAVGN